MNLFQKTTLWRYGATLILILLASLLRLALTPWLGQELPFGTFVVALVGSGFFLGCGPALLVTAVGAYLGTRIGFSDPGPLIPMAASSLLFVLTGLTVGSAAWLLQRFLQQGQVQTDRANLRAVEAHRHKDRFLMVLGHELRNPLGGISLAAELLFKQSSHDPKGVHLAQVIQRQTRHMQKLIDELLDISRIEQGKIQLILQSVALQQVIRTCLEQQSGQIKAKCQSIHLKVQPSPVIVPGDSDRLVQVLANLLTNASKYSGPNSRIEVHLAASGGEAVLEVRDNGSGLAADKIPLIFEPFMQVNPASPDSDGGLGLGLPTVKRLVELHRGSVVASSPGPGLGCVFTVRLPLAHSDSLARCPVSPLAQTGS